jgi:cytoskeleton-associated protein 5
VVFHLLHTGIVFLWYRDFGTKIVSIKPILKQLQTLLEDRDKTVRDETKLLVVEIYRWIGPALKPQLTNLKPVQV